MPQYTIPPYRVEQVIKSLSQAADWSIGQYEIPALWKDATGKGVKVAVLDTGCQTDHPDLQGQIKACEDFTNSRWGCEDRNDHGTWVAGMIAAVNNEVGVVGVAPEAELYIGKVLGDSGSGSSQSVANGIDWAREQGCQIVSMSLGSPYSDSTIYNAIKRFVDRRNCFIIAAAGNDGNPAGTDSINYPGKHPETIAVGAVDNEGRRTYFSSRGPAIDVMGPGQDMLSTVTGSQYASMSGTSMATPFVCGVITLALSKGIDFRDYNGLRDKIKMVSDDIGEVGFDPDTGWGLIDPDEVLESGNDTPDFPDTPNTDNEGITEFEVGNTTISFPVVFNGRAGIHIGTKEGG